MATGLSKGTQKPYPLTLRPPILPPLDPLPPVDTPPHHPGPPTPRVLCTAFVTIQWEGPSSLIEFHSIDKYETPDSQPFDVIGDAVQT